MIDAANLTRVDGKDNQWIDERGQLYVGRVGQTLVDFVAEMNSPVIGLSKITILATVTFWERLTEDKANQVNEAMATQPMRTQRIFATANTFRSDHELWPNVKTMATELFGEHRAAILMS
ncbi:hypothetical protein ACWF50_14955 [Brucella pseudogrignonensis]|jgi:hypothetical protein